MAEVVGALLSVMMIWIVTASLVYLAVQRVIHQDYEIDASVMIIMAGLSVTFNIWSVQRVQCTVKHICRMHQIFVNFTSRKKNHEIKYPRKFSFPVSGYSYSCENCPSAL